MTLDIDIDAGKINESLAKAVMESAIGVEIKAQIEKKTTDAYSLRQAVEKAVDSQMSKAISMVLSEPAIADKIKEAARSGITDALEGGLINAAFTEVLNKMEKRW